MMLSKDVIRPADVIRLAQRCGMQVEADNDGQLVIYTDLIAQYNEVSGEFDYLDYVSSEDTDQG